MDFELSTPNLIVMLETIKWRIVEYDKNMPHYPDDYKEQLIKADTATLDQVISILRSQA